jgi:GAF domain-containing protein
MSLRGELGTGNGALAELKAALAQRMRELDEARERETATAEVLGVISSSPGELESVFNAMLANATRLCGANFGILYLREGDGFRAVALHDVPLAFAEERRNKLIFPPPDTTIGQVARTKRPVETPDMWAEQSYIDGNPHVVATARLSGMRTIFGVPLLKDDQLIGTITIYRQEVRPFTDKQKALVSNFATQAVIAIENTRLLNELRQRTADLTEALEQQTATSEVLKVISSSPGDLEPVFQAMLENAVKLCKAKFGVLYRYEDNACFPAAMVNAPLAYAEFVWSRGRFLPQSGNALAVVLQTKEMVHTIDQTTEPVPTPSAKLAGARSQIIVPMLKEDKLIGAIAIFRQEVRPFTEKQITLLTNFAAQAVIAIENTRLLNELRERTAELSESLEQQTAAFEVLRIISTKPGDLQPVFDAILANATRICDARFGMLQLYDGKVFHVQSMRDVPPAFAEVLQREPRLAAPTTGLGRLVATKQPVHIEDCAADIAYAERDRMRVQTVELGGVRTSLVVPLLQGDTLLGGLQICRQEVRPFTEKQIALVANFANQAVIAIENTRLLTELRDRTEQLEKSYGLVREQAGQLEEQSQELRKLNQGLEQRVSEQVAEIERVGRLRRFLPPQVADLIVSSGAEHQLESHRREITALFCDLRGFTGFSESADPEDVMALLREYHAVIGSIIHKHGGTLERFVGDGVMVILNDPIPLPNPALQAVEMALEMRASIGELMEKWRRLGHELGFGIGISHGYATLGTIGFEGRFDYAAIGTVSNVASRLCDEALPGQILISPRVLVAVEGMVTAEPAGEFELKGIRRPMAVHNVTGMTAAKT